MTLTAVDMKRLTLIRHGKSSWDSPDQEDFERPLNSRGLRDCGRMPALISADITPPQAILSSDALRAKETSEAIAAGYEIAPEDIKFIPALYLAGLETLLDCLGAQDDSFGHLMLVGHNPGLTELHNYLCRETADDLPTFAVVDLQLAVDAWRDIPQNCASLENFLKPKLIG